MQHTATHCNTLQHTSASMQSVTRSTWIHMQWLSPEKVNNFLKGFILSVCVCCSSRLVCCSMQNTSNRLKRHTCVHTSWVVTTFWMDTSSTCVAGDVNVCCSCTAQDGCNWSKRHVCARTSSVVTAFWMVSVCGTSMYSSSGIFIHIYIYI